MVEVMTAVQQRSALNLWKLFYQKAEGERFLSALAGRQVKQYQKEIRKNHIVRLNEKRCDPVAGFA